MVGVSGVMGAVQSILDYAVDEVLETHGYREDDRVRGMPGALVLCTLVFVSYVGVVFKQCKLLLSCSEKYAPECLPVFLFIFFWSPPV